MSRVAMRKGAILLFVAIALVSSVAVAGCSPQQSSAPSGGENAANETVSAEAGAYVSDEQCLSCHGGSYEALAERTADLGDWNPHDSIHGGYNSCNNCHYEDKQLSYNYCNQCHVYAPDEEPLY
ncbi:cytochrome c3 family protein [Raoultibacter massiliensis]|uniref:cytochrome c3 family protein n=1 Tax=Raoultibacter massiliensis TaxID=1852371 RepID=UPI003A8F00A8